MTKPNCSHDLTHGLLYRKLTSQLSGTSACLPALIPVRLALLRMAKMKAWRAKVLSGSKQCSWTAENVNKLYVCYKV